MLQNREAELTALGMALADPQVALKVADLPQDAFSYDDTVGVFQGIRQVVKNHGNPDLVTVNAACTQLGKNLGGILAESVRMAITTANYDQYEAILMDLRKRRNLMNACGQVIAHAADMTFDTDALLKGVLEVASDTSDPAKSVPMSDALMSLLERLEKKEPAGISTGIAGLNSLIGGFKKGELIYLGARPGVGKTALALYMATYASLHAGPVLVVNLEMPPEELAARVLAEGTGVNVQSIVNNSLTPEDYGTLWGQGPKLSILPLRFTNYAKTPLQIRREAQAMQRTKEGLSMIVIDYLQLLKSDQPTGKRYEDVSDISRELKLLALDLNVPVLALTQFNRASEGGGGFKKRRPSMSEARDSGSIEQDANIFLTLYAPDEPKFGTLEHDFWQLCQNAGSEWQVLIVEKNRNGRLGQVSLKFDKPIMRFTTLTRNREDLTGGGVTV